MRMKGCSVCSTAWDSHSLSSAVSKAQACLPRVLTFVLLYHFFLWLLSQYEIFFVVSCSRRTDGRSRSLLAKRRWRRLERTIRRGAILESAEKWSDNVISLIELVSCTDGEEWEWYREEPIKGDVETTQKGSTMFTTRAFKSKSRGTLELKEEVVQG